MMKKIITAAIAAFAVTAQAEAKVFNGFAMGLNAGVLFEENKIPSFGPLRMKDANNTLGQFGVQFDYEMSKANGFYGSFGLAFSFPTGKSSSTKHLGLGNIKVSTQKHVNTELLAALGYNWCDKVVAYGITGFSVAKKHYQVKVSVGPNVLVNSKGSTTITSGILGAGVKTKLSDKISAGIEYKHEFQPNVKIKHTNKKFKSSSNEVLARVSYHF